MFFFLLKTDIKSFRRIRKNEPVVLKAAELRPSQSPGAEKHGGNQLGLFPYEGIHSDKRLNKSDLSFCFSGISFLLLFSVNLNIFLFLLF